VSLYTLTATYSETGASNADQSNSLAGYSKLADVWANYQPYTRKSGTNLEGGEFEGDTIGIFTIAYRSDLPTSGRILFNGHPYDILSKDVTKGSLRNEFLEIVAVWRKGT
jgi:head-tail adaptor